MELVKPGLGLLFWMLLSFSVVLYVLAKFAWKPILAALKEREQTIAESLNSAQKAKEEMERLNADNQKIIAEAKLEKEQLLREAREISQQIVAKSKEQAVIEGAKLIEAAKADIESQKAAAINQIKTQIVNLSIEIAEKLVRNQLADAKKQQELTQTLLKEVNFN